MTREDAKAKLDAIDFLDLQIDIVSDIIDQIYDEHEENIKQEYIDGSNSNNELIKSLHKQIKLKNAHI